MYTGDYVADRMRSDSNFIRALVRTLQLKNSFYYSFDSLQGISKIYAPDSTFKIFTWSLSFETGHRQRGAIQLKTTDGSLALIPLKDFSEFTPSPIDSIRTKDNWIGAVYYGIVKTTYNSKNFYTLFGHDANGSFSNKKWIEVLTFDGSKEPFFGGHFSFEKDSVKKENTPRYSLEYNKEATAYLNFTTEENVILISHLVSASGEAFKPYTYIPDGEYEGFEWKDGKWIHIENVFNTFGNRVSYPELIRDDEGNINQQKLDEFSQKSIQREKETKRKQSR
jgi:hypothetical protein